jgi:hypothetical protein
LDYAVGTPLYNANFNQNDGVNTTHIMNTAPGGDYLIVLDYDVPGEVDSKWIDSRWFIIDQERLRNGQYRLTLRRDLIVDFYEQVINATSFIEKATLKRSDPFIFNAEDMEFNQILKEQRTIVDDTGTAWVVGYVARNVAPTTLDLDIYNDSNSSDFIVENIEEWEYWKYCSTNPNRTNLYAYPSDIQYTFRYSFDRLLLGSYIAETTADAEGIYIGNNVIGEGESAAKITTPQNLSGFDQQKIARVIFSDFNKDLQLLKTSSVLYIGAQTSLETISFYNELNEKTIYDSTTGQTYRIEIRETETAFNVLPTSNLGIVMNESIVRSGRWFAGTSGASAEYSLNNVVGEDTFKISNIKSLELVLLQEEKNIKVTIPENRYHLKDAPYDMFCIPTTNIIVYKDNVRQFIAQGSLAINTATAIAAALGEGAVYDLQLLPFCPVQEVYRGRGIGIDVKSLNVSYITNSDGSENLSVMLWATKATFQFEVPFSIPSEYDDIEMKVKNQTDLHRICSPNYSGVFQFNAQKNGGVSSLSVSCTYKPYFPFIYIKPNFGKLYGINPSKDYRGLICGGDFSLAQVTSQWATYELQNKNYQAIFDRSIENMEFLNYYQRIGDIVNAASGSIMGSAGGAMAGMQGGPYGAIAGGIAGGALGTVGGILDVSINEKIRNEALDYTKDQFGYNLGNIKALPNSLSKTSAIVYNNKIFPFVEYYSCTEEEKEAFRNKLRYNGMTVMRIGRIIEYIRTARTYIKAKLIRIENINEDFHIANSIAGELDKGVFI